LHEANKTKASVKQILIGFAEQKVFGYWFLIIIFIIISVIQQ